MPASAHLTILGQGPDAPSLRARVEALGLGGRVDFPGFEPAPWTRYAGADAFVLPSDFRLTAVVRRFETLIAG